jgi:hypothetical protein
LADGFLVFPPDLFDPILGFLESLTAHGGAAKLDFQLFDPRLDGASANGGL